VSIDSLIVMHACDRCAHLFICQGEDRMPAVSLSPEEAPARFGWLAMFAGFDMPASSSQTQQRLAWRPTGPGLISDLDHMQYLEA
jgi:hypothetical protein